MLQYNIEFWTKFKKNFEQILLRRRILSLSDSPQTEERVIWIRREEVTMKNCIYCGNKMTWLGSCPVCKAANPMTNRRTEMSPEYADKLKQMNDALPERMAMEGESIHTPMIGFLIGLATMILIALLGYYLAQQYEKEKKREQIRLEQEHPSPRDRSSNKY